MSAIRVLYGLLLLIFTIWNTIDCQITRSRKKGLVIPYWPRHMCGDFDAFETVSWWYNYHTYKQVICLSLIFFLWQPHHSPGKKYYTYLNIFSIFYKYRSMIKFHIGVLVKMDFLQKTKVYVFHQIHMK